MPIEHTTQQQLRDSERFLLRVSQTQREVVLAEPVVLQPARTICRTGVHEQWHIEIGECSIEGVQ